MPCFSAKHSNSGSLAIVPSSFMISTMTPAGSNPARRARSTQASVCPVRCKTPPSLACRGKRWPGVTMSVLLVSGAIRVCTVVDRSKAEMPVVVLALASTDTVKAVPMDSVFWLVMSGRPSSRRRASVMGMQIKPRPKRAMKLIDSGVTISGRHHQVAFILPVLIVQYYYKAARPHILDRLFYATKWHRRGNRHC